MRVILLLCFLSVTNITVAQLPASLTKAINQLQDDAQFKHALISLCVLDNATGQVVFERNSEIGMVPASCQKIVTSAAAFALLGADYRFKTALGYDGKITDSTLYGNLILRGFGDPSLGSGRFVANTDFYHLPFFNSIRLAGIRKIKGMIYADDSRFEFQHVPKGWVWEDVGNYFGAGAGAFNWNENTYSLHFRSGNQIGSQVEIVNQPAIQEVGLLNNVTAGKAGSGDQAIIFLPPYGEVGSVEGTIPVNEDRFIVKGAVPDPTANFIKQVKYFLDYHKIGYDSKLVSSYYASKMFADTLSYSFNSITTHFSPSLDSINYWFLKKSINLYGEAFVKTIALEKDNFGSTARGIQLIREFWNTKGIEKSALNIIDGSGLSPANRVTTRALVAVLRYASTQKWYSSFYNALPEMNGIKMKDGYIAGVRAYAGYITSAAGKAYTFSFIANNIDGSASTAREKIWKLLNLLK